MNLEPLLDKIDECVQRMSSFIQRIEEMQQEPNLPLETALELHCFLNNTIFKELAEDVSIFKKSLLFRILSNEKDPEDLQVIFQLAVPVLSKLEQAEKLIYYTSKRLNM